MTLTGSALSERRQQQLLRGYATHSVTAILSDPDQGVRQAREGMAGSSHQRMPDGTATRMETTTVGIGFGGEWGNPHGLLTWTQVKDLAHSIPEALREEVADWRRRGGEHQRTYPRFTVSPAATGCGPAPATGPLTARQQAYAEELSAWEAGGTRESWEALKVELETERDRLHDRALPLTVDHEPQDLLSSSTTRPPPKRPLRGRRSSHPHRETTSPLSSRAAGTTYA